MYPPQATENSFIKKLIYIIETQSHDQHFGVSILAREMGISRSYLYRRVFAHARISVSLYIRNIRLQKSKELLEQTSDSVSEIAYNVGFNNVSYFIKCFHEYYGYSPGEFRKNGFKKPQPEPKNHKRLKILWFTLPYFPRF